MLRLEKAEAAVRTSQQDPDRRRLLAPRRSATGGPSSRQTRRLGCEVRGGGLPLGDCTTSLARPLA